MTRLLAAALPFALLTLSACSTPSEPAAPKPAQADAGHSGPKGVGMANPASVHCQKLGGTLEIRTGKDGGQYGLCHLPDGRVCEEWALMRDGKCEKPAE